MNQIGTFNQTIFYKKQIKTKKIKHFANEILKDSNINNAELNIIFISKAKMRKLNKQYRGKNKTTDVISFALEDTKDVFLGGVRILGDIYISPKVAKIQSKKYHHSFEREIYFLTTHGILHLLGYDHQNKKQEKIMFKKQKELLNGKIHS